MQRILTAIAPLAACLMLLIGVSTQAEDAKINPTGTWTWTSPGQNGQTRTNTMKLKLEKDVLTGTINGRGSDTAIDDAKLKGDEIAFSVTREFNGNKRVMKYNGKLSGDTIKGKIQFERDGQDQSRDWEAKREVAAAK